MTALCVIYANCQGDILRQILQQTKSFNDKFHIHLYTNYICQPINEEDFKKSGISLEEYNNPTEETISKLISYVSEEYDQVSIYSE